MGGAAIPAHLPHSLANFSFSQLPSGGDLVAIERPSGVLTSGLEAAGSWGPGVGKAVRGA